MLKKNADLMLILAAMVTEENNCSISRCYPELMLEILSQLTLIVKPVV